MNGRWWISTMLLVGGCSAGSDPGMPDLLVEADLASPAVVATVNGSVGGSTLAAKDASYIRTQTVNSGTESIVQITDYAHTCAALQSKIDRKGSIFLAISLVQIDAMQKGTAPAAAGTFAVFDPKSAQPQPGAAAVVQWRSFDASCGALDTFAASGTVTVTALDATHIAGTFDATTKGGSHLTGTFDAPTCDAALSGTTCT